MIGQVYGSYRITRRIGEGGVGAVYEAEHIHVGRKAAVKVLLPAWSRNKLVIERFINEARSSALANHPGIVEIFDCGQAENGRVFLVMELLDGEPLSKTLKQQETLPIPRMTSVSRQIASALAAAHDKGVIHRDLKPDNIFLIPDRNAQTGERIKVLDFGVAKLASTKHVNTFVGVMLGTPLYMSPEQCISSGEVDGRSDIYSLGCIMFEMVCGRPPFVHHEASTLAMMHVEEPIPRPRKYRPDIPANVESLIIRTLAKDREARPQSMADLRAELDVVWGLLPSESRRAPQLASPGVPAKSAPTSSDDGGDGSPGIPVVGVPPAAAPGLLAARPGTHTAIGGQQKKGSAAGQPGNPSTSAAQSSTGNRPGTSSVRDRGGDDKPAQEGDEQDSQRWLLRLVTSLVVLVVVGVLAYLFLFRG